MVVTRTVTDHVVGSGIAFQDRGERRAEGRPWELATVPRRGLT